MIQSGPARSLPESFTEFLVNGKSPPAWVVKTGHDLVESRAQTEAKPQEEKKN